MATARRSGSRSSRRPMMALPPAGYGGTDRVVAALAGGLGTLVPEMPPLVGARRRGDRRD